MRNDALHGSFLVFLLLATLSSSLSRPPQVHCLSFPYLCLFFLLNVSLWMRHYRKILFAAQLHKLALGITTEPNAAKVKQRVRRTKSFIHRKKKQSDRPAGTGKYFEIVFIQKHFCVPFPACTTKGFRAIRKFWSMLRVRINCASKVIWKFHLTNEDMKQYISRIMLKLSTSMCTLLCLSIINACCKTLINDFLHKINHIKSKLSSFGACEVLPEINLSFCEYPLTVFWWSKLILELNEQLLFWEQFSVENSNDDSEIIDV